MYLKEIHENSPQSKLNRAEVYSNAPKFTYFFILIRYIVVLLSASVFKGYINIFLLVFKLGSCIQT